jgi:hypothetical protein
VARTGFAMNGLIHLLIGGIAIGLAFGDSSAVDADQSGALEQLAGSALGLVAIWAAVVGLLTLGVWQLTRAGGSSHPHRLARWGRRISESTKGIVYLGIGGSALVIALGGTLDSSRTINGLATRLLENPLGGWILLGVGLGVVGSGIGFISIGARRSFRKLIRVPEGGVGRAVVVLGISGYVAKGIALGITGVLFVVAALTSDAQRVTGLDGALRALGDLPFGIVWLVLVALGLIQYGLFLVARAKLARL